MDAAQVGTLGRLSRAVTAAGAFDIETEALVEREPQVRTFVFQAGRVVDRVVWAPRTRALEVLRSMVDLQHARVRERIEEHAGALEEGQRLLGSIPPPAHVDEAAGVDAPVQLAPTTTLGGARGDNRKDEMRDAQSISDALAATGVVSRAQVVDDEGFTIASVGDDAWLAELAFLSAGLDALLGAVVDLGPFVGAALERADHQVLVVQARGRACAFVPPPRTSPVRAFAAVRAAIEEDDR